MALPGSFPAWLSSPGQPDALVFDATGYNAASAQGFVYPVVAGRLVTPSKVVSATLTITPTSLNQEQSDASNSKGKSK